jgi:hypothetical protein
MKSLLFIGGYLGFVFGLAFSFLRKEAWLECVWHGGLTALLVASVLPCWGLAWKKYWEQSLPSRQYPSDSLLSTSTQPTTSKS